MNNLPDMNDELLNRTVAHANDYLNTVNQRPVFPTAQAVELMQQLPEELPETGLSPHQIIDALHQFGSPATVATNASRYFGFVIGAAYPIAMAANMLATVWDQCAGLRMLSPVGSHVEEIAGKWLLDIFNLPGDQAVGFVSGATMANFSGIIAARHHLLIQKGWDVMSKGLYGAPEIKVVVGEEVHVSVLKALSLSGLGSQRVLKVPVDDQGRMIANQLPELDDMTIVFAQAGNVDSGASDPILDICSAMSVLRSLVAHRRSLRIVGCCQSFLSTLNRGMSFG